MYGAGLDGLFKGLFRMAFPFLKIGFAIAKPHLKTAVKGIVNNVVSNILTSTQSQNQWRSYTIFHKSVSNRNRICSLYRIFKRVSRNTVMLKYLLFRIS